MAAIVGKQAIVVGAGMGGLAVAGAAADYFERVIVLERDSLPSSAQPLAPERHKHNILTHFLVAANLLLSRYFPDSLQR